MLGLKLFYKCDDRLKEGKHCSTVPFGGLCVFLVGDWSQLPPVGDKSLYVTGNTHETIQSSFLYSLFDKVYFLTEIMRKQGDNQKIFREALNQIANGTINEADYAFLQTRFYVNNVQVAHDFEDAVYIMSKNANIARYNYEKLKQTRQPVVIINATQLSSGCFSFN